MTRNVFVYSYDDFNMELLQSVGAAEDCRFHGLLSYDEVRGNELQPRQCLEKAADQLREFPGSVDAIVGYWDFPVTTTVPLLCKSYGLPAPSLESVLKCEHKYWSRLIQQQILPEYTPAFDKVGPFDDDALSKLGVRFPFWIKPVKSFSSHLAFRVTNEAEFDDAIGQIREGIARFAEPFNYFLDQVDLPPEVAGVGGHHCVVEEIVSGDLCTVEGYVQHGRTHVYGVVDSIMDEEGNAFARYQYPSSLAERTQEIMGDTAAQLIEHIGLDDSTFNVEFFHGQDGIRILEINPRLSQSHSWLFESVDGISNHQVMTAVALGQVPGFTRGSGEFNVAAKFFMRAYRDARVVAVPTEADIEHLQREVDGVSVVMQAEPNRELSELPEQSSYSYDLADVYIGARNQRELMRKFERCQQVLKFRFERKRMRIARDLPHPVEQIENIWIALSDGTRLAAKLWMPEGAREQPVPAILEYIPYRKRDGTAGRDTINHGWLAGHGYACVRVDIRGSGDSDGVLPDEYLPQERDDGLEVLQWIAAQPWCDGGLAMMGISWGGFNALQIAARQPPQLKAVIALSASDDRYGDDVHYMGGCLLGDNLSWASSMFAHVTSPPDPAIVGDRWRDMWLERLENAEPWVDSWLRHQHRDEFWQYGSVCEDYSAIRCPVMAVSGWADGYSNAVFRLMENLQVPRRGLIGPWSHMYPHQGLPGPAIGFLQEVREWCDHWLKGIDYSAMREPVLRVWMQESVPPTMHLDQRPGRWVEESAWPSPNIRRQRLALHEGCLVPDDQRAREDRVTLQSPLSVGLFAGKWCSFSATPDLPHDQREEDGGSLVFDSERLDEPLEIMGAPVAELELTADRPTAMVAVRLSDVAVDGKATRVTYGLCNLTHRNGSERPEALVPGRRYRVQVALNGVAQVFPPGHRLRLSVSTSYWPLAWLPPAPAMLTVFTGASKLSLPVRPPRDEDEHLISFDDPEGAPPLEETTVRPRHYDWLVHRDLARDVSTLEVVKDEGIVRNEAIDMALQRKTVERYSYTEDDFRSPRGEVYTERGFERGDWSTQVRANTVLTCDEEHFFLRADLDAYEGEERVFCRSWKRKIARRLL